MPFFSVLVHGTGIEVTSQDESTPITGFYVVRLVRSASALDAETKVRANVASDWSTGGYGKTNKGGPPSVSVDTVTQISLLEWLRARNSGYIFYPEKHANDD